MSNNFWFSEYARYGLPTFLVDVSTVRIVKVNSEMLSLLGLFDEAPCSLEGKLFTDLKSLCDVLRDVEIECIVAQIMVVAECEKWEKYSVSVPIKLCIKLNVRVKTV